MNQNQHKIPQVYLRKFGYQSPNRQWKVSVKVREEEFVRQKSIKSFLAETNVFEFDSEDPRLSGIFEKLNCDLETEYSNILNELHQNGKLSNKSNAYLLQILANFIVRADHWREWILNILNSRNKENFLRIILGHHCKNYEEFKVLHTQPFFRILVENNANTIINRVLLYFIDHLMVRIRYYEVTFIQSQANKPWFTTDNPVVVHNRTKRLEILAPESELYLPLSPEFLAYFHFKDSSDKENHLRELETNTIRVANDEDNVSLQRVILANPSNHLIFSGYVNVIN